MKFFATIALLIAIAMAAPAADPEAVPAPVAEKFVDNVLQRGPYPYLYEN